MTSSVSSNRVFGLSGSGMDVDSMVQKLMAAERKPYDKLTQTQTFLGWKKEDYNTMYTSLNDFNNKKVFDFQLQSNLAPKTVTSSNTAAVTVSANSDALNVNHSIKVTQLAMGVTESSTSAITTGSDKSTLEQQFGITNGYFNIKINGKTIGIDTSKSINDVVSSINNSGAGVTAAYDTTSDRFFMYTSATGSSASIDFAGSDPRGMSLLTKNLKLSPYGEIGSLGATSASSMASDPTATLTSQFSGLATTPFVLKFSNGGAASSITINPGAMSINDIITQINGVVDADGKPMATASFANGAFTLKSKTIKDITLTGSDLAGMDFLNNQLKLGIAADTTPINSTTGVTTAGSVGFDTATALSTQFTGLAGSFDLKIFDGTTTKTVTIDTTKSLDAMMTDINALMGTDGKQLATASFVNGKFTIKANNSDIPLDLTSSDNEAIDFLNNNLKLTAKQGQDATFRLDGINMTQSSNKFTVSGVTYSLQAVGASTVNIQTDVDKIVSNVKTFVEDYNKQLSAIYTKIGEARNKDYQPLTDEQKAAMKDSDIVLWTAKAKSGTLRNDTILKSLAENMRDLFTRSISGTNSTYTTAASIGISTGPDWTENGKLYLDEDKLKKALLVDNNIAYKMFGATGATTSTSGIAVQLKSALKTATDKIVKEAGISASTTTDVTSTIGRQYSDLVKQMATMNLKLQGKENRYYTQFTAMETALAKLTQQNSSLVSMLGQ